MLNAKNMSRLKLRSLHLSIKRRPAFYLIVLILVLLVTPSRADKDDWIFSDFTINHEPVHFMFDSGSEGSYLFRSAAERLGIKIIPTASVTPPPSGVQVVSTEPLIVTFGDATAKKSIYVGDAPPHMPQGIDGIIALDLLTPHSGDVMLIDMDKHLFSPITFPTDIGRWSKWKMVPGPKVPMFECGDGEKIGIDTGATAGVYLSPKKWEKWRSQRYSQPASIDGYFSLDGKMHVSEEMRARKLTFGDFTLTDVPVRLETQSATNLFKGYDAIIGSFALYQIKVIIDRQHNTIYTLSNAGSPPPYDWNRLGAVFVPSDLVKSDDLTAHVVPGSPAYLAGIRDTDVLEKVDDLDVTRWKTDPTVLLLMFPAFRKQLVQRFDTLDLVICESFTRSGRKSQLRQTSTCFGGSAPVCSMSPFRCRGLLIHGSTQFGGGPVHDRWTKRYIDF
jgi:hypothetical protein